MTTLIAHSIQQVSAMVATRTDEDVIWWATFLNEVTGATFLLEAPPIETRMAALEVLAAAHLAGQKIITHIQRMEEPS